MLRRSPRSPRTYTLLPYTQRVRSSARCGQQKRRRRKKPGRHVSIFLHYFQGFPINPDPRCTSVCDTYAPEGESLLSGNMRIDAKQKPHRSEEHTSELQSLMRISYAVFCLTKKKTTSLH